MFFHLRARNKKGVKFDPWKNRIEIEQKNKEEEEKRKKVEMKNRAARACECLARERKAQEPRFFLKVSSFILPFFSA